MLHKNYDLIILDRDGVINEDSDDYVKSVDEWKPILGSIEAIKKLNNAKKIVAVATNQSGIARGLFSEATLHAMHDKFEHLLKNIEAHVDKIIYCPHSPDDHCDCRKPKPGMIKTLMKHFNVPPHKTLVVGDSARDLESAKAAGCDSVLVKTGKGLRVLAKSKIEEPIFENLMEVVDALLVGDSE
jgi:D-glycero-D-manno-heptose 1,7-bisphosphate phosphatase